MTATPRSVKNKLQEMNVPYEVFDYTGSVRSDKIAKILHYGSFSALIEKLDRRAIIYTPSIKQIKEFSTLADNGQRRIACLWSMHNAEYPMSQDQQNIRDEILKTEHIPSDIDLLFINAAYETSINTRNEDFKTMIVHTGDKDVHIQARGRLRHDIDTLYLYDSKFDYIVEYFPNEFYDRPLFSCDTAALAEQMNLRNGKSRMLKWPSIKKLLSKSGIHIQHMKKAGSRCYVIHRNCA